MVDVGGGMGSFLAALLGAHPHLHGTLVDLPAPSGGRPTHSGPLAWPAG